MPSVAKTKIMISFWFNKQKKKRQQIPKPASLCFILIRYKTKVFKILAYFCVLAAPEIRPTSRAVFTFLIKQPRFCSIPYKLDTHYVFTDTSVSYKRVDWTLIWGRKFTSQFCCQLRYNKIVNADITWLEVLYYWTHCI